VLKRVAIKFRLMNFNNFLSNYRSLFFSGAAKVVRNRVDIILEIRLSLK